MYILLQSCYERSIIRWFYQLLMITGVSALFAIPVAAQSPVPDDAQVEQVLGGFEFLEGPYWRAGGYLVFSDIPANTIYRWTPGSDSAVVFYRPSGHSNGITADEQGRLILAQHSRRRIARMGGDGQETALATHFKGKRLNSPNDVVVASDGSVYFTDPPFAVKPSERELNFAGVYRITPGGELVLITKAFKRPNGIALSPDETRLYVNDTAGGYIRVFDRAEDGTISNGRRFAVLKDSTVKGWPDGMTVDALGRVYSTGPGGIWIFSPDGELLDRISLPRPATNVTFGGAEGHILFIIAGPNLYRIRLNAEGVVSSCSKNLNHL